jgi:hypothetical protein
MSERKRKNNIFIKKDFFVFFISLCFGYVIPSKKIKSTKGGKPGNAITAGFPLYQRPT